MPSDWRTERPNEIAESDIIAGEDPRSGFMQSSFWSAFKRSEGYEVTRLVYAPNGVRSGSATLLRFPMSQEAGFVLCPEGPVLPWEDETTARAALRDLQDTVRRMPNVVGLRIEPHLSMPLPSLLRNWADAPTDLTPCDTLLLDLTDSDGALLSRAHPKCRYNLRVADRHGIEVRSTTDIEIAHDFYELLLETSGRTGFFVEPFGFFLNLMTTLFQFRVGELFVARLDGIPLAAILVVYFGRRATYLYGASSNRRRNAMPAYPLHRAAIQAARERGCVEYDLYGIDAFQRRDHLYAGITRFKLQWGGTIERRIGARDYVFYDRLADLVVERLKSAP